AGRDGGAAGALRPARREHVAFRVASGTYRPVGVPVFRRPRGPSGGSRGRRGARRFASAGALSQAPGLLSGGRGVSAKPSSATGSAAGVAAQAPEYVRRIAPYVGGKPIDELAREYGLAEASIIKLASNENPRGPSPRVRAAIATAAADITRYPDGNGFALKTALAARLGIAREQIVLGNGSNDVLELAAQAFLRPGDHAIYSQHGFAVYPLAVQARGATGIEVAARAYGHDLDAMRAAITPRTRVVFLANPNNPTGTWLSSADVKAFLVAVPREVVVVLDEAYDEYLEAGQRSHSVTWLGAHANLIVSRTFS